jgi:hypothetical protein
MRTLFPYTTLFRSRPAVLGIGSLDGVNGQVAVAGLAGAADFCAGCRG